MSIPQASNFRALGNAIVEHDDKVHLDLSKKVDGKKEPLLRRI